MLPSAKSSKKRNKGGRRRNAASGALIAPNLAMGGSNLNALSQIVEPWMPLFPTRTTKWLRYSTNFGLTSTAGVVTSYVFRANDLFDPDVTGGGHQPMGFDQMMVFYNHFCVTHAKLIVSAKAATGTASTVAVRVDASATPLTTIDQIIEFGGLVQAELEAIGGFGANKVLALSVSIPQLQGVVESAITADPTLRGDAATSPTELTYFHVQLWNAAAVTATANISVILEQRSVFMEPRDFSESLRSRVTAPAVQRSGVRGPYPLR
jgi:hypothetical protein